MSSINYKYAMLNEISVVAGSTTTNNFALSPEVVRYADDFGDNSVNSNDWETGILPGGVTSSLVQVNETNQRLEIGFTGTTNDTRIFNGLVTKTTKDFTDSSVIVAVPQIGRGNSTDGSGKNAVKTRVEIGNADTDKIQLELFSGGGTIRRHTVDGIINSESIFPSEALAKYFRIRHNNTERRFYFESSSNGAENSWREEKHIQYNPDGTFGPPSWLSAAKVSLNMGREVQSCEATPCLNPLSAFDDFKFVKNATLLANAGADQAVTVNTTPTLSGAPNSASSYKWTFTGKPEGAPDPTIANSTSQSTEIGNLSFLGDYYFQLTVSDGNGSFSTDEIRVRTVAAPEATILAPSTILEDEPIVFDGTTSPGAFTYEWDFGDGNKAELGRATHVYMKPGTSGTYTATLTIKSEAGATASTTKQITVNALPTATTTDTTLTCSMVSGVLTGDPTMLQMKIDNAVGRTDIVLPDGCEFKFNLQTLNLPVKSGNDYIVIRSASAGSFAQGTRVSRNNSADVAKMAYLSATAANNATLVEARKNSHHYRFEGIYFRRLAENTNTILTHLIDLATKDPANPTEQIDLTQVPRNFIFNHCIFENAEGVGTRRAISLNSKDSSVLNSAFYNFRGNEGDSNAIGAWATPGIHAIVNNHLEGGSENLIYGGETMYFPYVTPSDITIRGNYLFKPLAWRDVDFDGVAKDKPNAKNVFELKHAKNVIFDGNVLENNWRGQDQFGFIIVLTVRNQNADNPWTTIKNVQITNNKVINSPSGVNFLAIDDGGRESVPSSDIVFHNNLFDRIGDPTNYPNGGTAEITSLMNLNPPPRNLRFSNNTFIRTTIASGVAGSGRAFYGETLLWRSESGFVFVNNILKLNAEAFHDTTTSPQNNGIKFLDTFVPNWKMQNNVMFYRSADCDTMDYKYPGFPENNRYCGEFNSAQNFPNQFVNFNGGNGGDYNLVTGSLANNYPSTGQFVGVNISTINTAAGKATGGTWTLP